MDTPGTERGRRSATPGPQSSAPCDAKFLDVKATDDTLPLLWRLIPLSPSLKTKATVEIRKLPGLYGIPALGGPETRPNGRRPVVDETSTNGFRVDVDHLTGPTASTRRHVNGGSRQRLEWLRPATVAD